MKRSNLLPWAKGLLTSRMAARVLGVLLLVISVGSVARAQDAVTNVVPTNTLGSYSWSFCVKNGNTNHLSINHVKMEIQTSGVTFGQADQPTSWTNSISGTPSSFTFDATGGSINVGATLCDFKFDLFSPPSDQPVTITWTTYNNSTQMGTGSMYIIPTDFQTRSVLDTSWGASIAGQTDPTFSFNFKNRSTNGDLVHQISYQILDQTMGNMRPSKANFPIGWALDSVTAYSVYFHAISSDLVAGSTVNGLIAALRANTNISNFSFVWRAYTSAGLLIDRDTIRNISANSSAGGQASQDTVTANSLSGCLYSFNLENSHATNLNLPGRVGALQLSIPTAGVTFEALPSKPINWGAAINKNGDSAFFRASSGGDAVPGGITNTNFSASVHNPTGGNFTIHWQTMKPDDQTKEISSGDIALKCSEAAKVPDDATLSTAAGNCCYKITVANSHTGPPSNLYAIALQMPAADGNFMANPASSLNWTPSTPTGQSIRFQVPGGGTEQVSGASQDLNFCLNLKKSSTVITWSTYETGSNVVLSTGTIPITCSATTGLCDSVDAITVSANDCSYNFVIKNKRTAGAAIRTVKMTPAGGWHVETASANVGWTATIDPSKAFVTYTSPTGIEVGLIQGNFKASFAGTGTSSVPVTVSTTDANSKTCDTIMTFTCTAGVKLGDISKALGLAVSPNPFKASTSITFDLVEATRVNVTLLDILGNVKQTVMVSNSSVGHQELKLDGNGLAAGSYYVRIETDKGVATRRVVLQ